MPTYYFVAEKDSLREAIKTGYKTLKSPPYDAVFDNVFGYYISLKEPDEYSSNWGKPYRPDVLPMIPDNFQYKKSSGTLSRRNVDRLIKELQSGKYDYIVNACDAAREGESIFWTLYNYAGCKVPVKRLWIDDYSTPKMAKALLNLRDYSSDTYIQRLKDSAYGRLELDWLIGMNLSRAAMIATRKPISVGRVKSPTLNIVVQRELEIANFKPQDFFEVEGEFSGYKGSWFKDKQTSFSNKAEAEALVKKLGKIGIVKDVKEETQTEQPRQLFSLPELQKESNVVLGFTAQQTLDLAQSLYENHKVISYPRTDSQYLTTAMGAEIPDLLKVISPIPETQKFVNMILANPSRISTVQSAKRYVDDSKVSDHHAIICTQTAPNFSKMTDKEKSLYLLIVKSFVAIFLDPKISAKTTIITDIDGESFRSTGTVILQKGYTEVMRDTTAPTGVAVLPKVAVGEKRNVTKLSVIGKQTSPPRPYTDASLIAAMQNAGRFIDDKEMKKILTNVKGIGTPATQAGIIEDLINKNASDGKNFLYRKGKTIRATDFGIQTIKTLDGHNIISPQLTAEWEQKLQSIVDGDIPISTFRMEMAKFVRSETADFLKNLGSADGFKIGDCPICGKPILDGKNYFRCTNYKAAKDECGFIVGKEICGQTISTEDIKIILSGKKTEPKKFKSKAGKTFTAALMLDESHKLSFDYNEGVVIGKCPKCGKDIVEKSGSYACECGFFIAKRLKGTTITATDVKNLISGKATSSKKFIGDSKKPWYAKLRYSKDFSKLEFEFVKKD